MTFLKACDWSGHIFRASASPRSPSSTVTVHGGQYDSIYVMFEFLFHATFVADNVWGFMLEPAGIYYMRIQTVNATVLPRGASYIHRD